MKELATFGREKIMNLVDQFSSLLSMEEVDAIPGEWQAFKMHVCHLRTSDPKAVFRDLLVRPPPSMVHFLPLVEIMLTISMSTAIVERLFSHMNNIKDSTRTLLGNKNLNNLLEIKVNGPSLEAFKAEEPILHWYEICTGTRHVNGHKH